MSAEVELVGALTDEEQLVHCIGELRAAPTRFRVYSPIPSKHIWRAQLKAFSDKRPRETPRTNP
jgi:hypothetical protein